jgi:hypothetical protein
MKHKIGDTVRIQSKKWIGKQKKVPFGFKYWFSWDMLKYAGETAKIKDIVAKDRYVLVDMCDHLISGFWEDWMFDSNYKPDEDNKPNEENNELSPEKAFWALLNGEILFDINGIEYSWRKEDLRFYMHDPARKLPGIYNKFTGLYRCCSVKSKYKRSMSREEVQTWAYSEASLGWMVRNTLTLNAWTFPNYFEYTGAITEYQRAKPLPDLSGIDENTIQGFEIEE